MASIHFGASPSTPTLRPPADQFRLVQRLETWGFESVWSGDHVSFHNPIFESLTLLATYAGITTRIKLGVGVGGENPKEFEVCGVPHKERGARVTEHIDAVRTLWRDSPASFSGRFTQFDKVSLDPKPVQQPG